MRFARLVAGIVIATAFSAAAQTLALDNELQRSATVTNTTVTMTGHSELHLTGTGDPLTGSTVHLNSEDAWIFFHAVKPSAAAALLSHVRVNGAAAVTDTNVRVVEHVNGAVVIPHPANYQPLRVFNGLNLTGASKKLSPYTGYGVTALGAFNDRIRSFTLKRGYTATFARNEDGTGASKNYVAQDSDLEVSLLPTDLDNSISFVRVFPWRWTAKKGTCDTDPVALNAAWNYNWNLNSNSTPNWEYVAIKQQRWWPGLNQDWKARGINHLLGYNEPNNPVEDAYTSLDNGSTTTAVAAWPELLSTGLRVGAPAVTDGGYSWIVDFMNKARAAGHRVDYVPVHYYRSYSNNNNPAGAASALYNFLKGIYDATGGLPIWLTEFNNGANWTGDADPSFEQNKNVIEAMVNMMDSTPWIERYSVYSSVEEVRQVYYNGGGLTPMGVMYRDHVSPIAHQQVVPDSGKTPAADYLFEGNTRDTSGNGNNPLVYGTPKQVAGKQGTALSFDGAEDYLSLPPRIGDSTDFTFTAWVKWNGGANWQRIFDLGNGTANNLFLSPSSGSGTLRFSIKQNNGTEQQLNTTVLPTNVWTHLAVTISGDTGKLFVNGALVATNNAMTINPGDLGTFTNYIGKSQYPDPLFNGLLDSVRFFSTALSDAQIASAASSSTLQFNTDPLVLSGAVPLKSFTASLAANATTGNGNRTFSKLGGPAWLAVAADGNLTGVPMPGDVGKNTFTVAVTDGSGLTDVATLEVPVSEAPGMVARYAFNGNTAAAVGTMNGTATGSPAYTTGKFSSAILFDGTDDFVTLPAGIANHDTVTFASWVWWNGGNQWQRIFDFGNGQGEAMFLSPRSGSNTLRFSITRDGAAEQQLNTTQLVTNTWTHIAVTLGGGIGKLYVNGVLADTQAITLKPSDILPRTNFLGKSQWPDPLFAGRLDEFVIFNNELTAAQVDALRLGTPPAFSSDPFTKPDATAGSPYQDSIIVGGSGLAYSKAGGPNWLAVDPDGRISGVPDASDAGTNRFTVRATAPNGYADDATMSIAVPASSGLMASYQLHGSAADSAGSFHGTVSGGPVYGSGVFDQAITLDGTDDVVTLPSGMLNGMTDITFAARVRWDGGNDWQRIFDFGSSTVPSQTTGAYLMMTPKTGNNFRFTITTNGYGIEQNLNGPALPVGEWSHVAVTLTGNTGRLYLNGALVDTKTITFDPANVAPTLNYLGKSQFAADPNFRGAIDDFRIYNRGLTGAEVSALAIPLPPTVVPASAYQAWASSVVFPEGESGAVSDPDRDGLANVFEFLFGSDPLVDSSGNLPVAQVRTAAELGLAGEKHYLSVSARIKVTRTGVTVFAESGDSPAELTTGHAFQAGAAVPDGEYEIVTWYHDIPQEDAPLGFIRLRATSN